MRKEKALLLLSGGLDSAVCLYYSIKEYEVIAITFDYFGRREAERIASQRLAKKAGVNLISIDLGFLKEISDAPIKAFKNKTPSSFIPARNVIFYGIAAHFAERVGASVIIGGHLRYDKSKFPDASKEFFRELNRLLRCALGDSKIKVLTPFIQMSKSDVIKLGISLKVPFELCWSCYEEGPEPCGKCEACIERSKAFKIVGVPDPLTKRGPGGI